MPHGRTSLAHDPYHVEHLIYTRVSGRADETSLLGEPLMGMGGVVPVEYTHLGLAERAVVDHVVVQPDVVSVASPVENRVQQLLVARPSAGREVGHMELHNCDDACCARVLAPLHEAP